METHERRDSPRSSPSHALKQQLAQALSELAIAKDRAASSDAQLSTVADQNKALSRKAAQLKRANTELQGEHELLKRDLFNLQMENHEIEGQAMMYRVVERDSRAEVLDLQVQLEEQATAHDSKISALQAKTSRLIMGVLPKLTTSDQLPRSHPVHTDALTDQTAASVSPDSASGSRSGSAGGVTHTLSLAFDDAAVQEHVLSILGRLCADDISEDEAVLQLSTFSHSLQMLAVQDEQPQKAQAKATPAALGSNPDVAAPSDASVSVVEAVQAYISAEAQQAAVSEQQAAVSEQQAAVSEQQAAVSEHQTPMSSQAGSSVAGTSSSRQSMEMPQTSGNSNHIYLSQFILSDPEKLQRLIARSHYRSPNPSILATAASGPTIADAGQSSSHAAADNTSASSSSSSGTSKLAPAGTASSPDISTPSLNPSATGWAGRFLNNFTTWNSVPSATSQPTPSHTLMANTSTPDVPSQQAAPQPVSEPTLVAKGLPPLPSRGSPSLRIVGAGAETLSTPVVPGTVVRRPSLNLNLVKDGLLSAAGGMLDAAKEHAAPTQTNNEGQSGGSSSSSSSKATGSLFGSQSLRSASNSLDMVRTDSGQLVSRK